MTVDSIKVSYSGGDALRYVIRDHIDVVDQPRETGGEDRGPTPTELFVASVATCMGFYAQRFLRRNDIDPDGLEIVATFTMADDRPARVAEITVRAELPPSVPERLVAPLKRVMNGCTVHNTLHHPPEIALRLVPNEPAA
jgi:uncharacterized OsmC-like protein